MPAATSASTKQGESATDQGALTVDDLSFAGAGGHRPDATFARGETALCLMTLTHFSYRQGQVDLTVDARASQGATTIIDAKDLTLLRGKAPTTKPGLLRSALQLELPAAAPPGNYRLELVVHDRLAKTTARTETEFKLAGEAPAATSRLALAVAPKHTITVAGAVAPLTVTLRGLVARHKADGYRLDAVVSSRLQGTKQQPLLTTIQRRLPFAPSALAVEHAVITPRDLAAGRYPLSIEVEDKNTGRRAQSKALVEVAPPAFAVHNIHIHDAAHLSRSTFRFGEQIFVRFALYGFASQAGQAKLAADLAISGPEGGVYFARKDAATTSGKLASQAAAAGRFPTQIPLVLPSIAPAGSYRLVIRARDLISGKSTVGQATFVLEGATVKRLSKFQLETLEIRLRPDLPPVARATLIPGTDYYFSVRAGGAGLRKVGRAAWQSDIAADLRLRSLDGKLVYEKKGVFAIKRRFHHNPLRVVLNGKVTIPANLSTGIYTLEVRAIDEIADRVSLLSRRVILWRTDTPL